MILSPSLWGAVLALGSAIFLIWATVNPLWLDVGEDSVRVRWCLQSRDYTRNELKVFFLDEKTTIRRIENVYRFAHFKTKSGHWFKIRVSHEESEWLCHFLGEKSVGKNIIQSM
jgi:hypothetical protein